MKSLISLCCLLISLPSFSQPRNLGQSDLDSILVHKWVLASVREKDAKKDDGKIVPFVYQPSELPNIIEFLKDGTVLIDGFRKGKWRTASAKDTINIIVDGKQDSYEIVQIERRNLKLQRISGEHQIISLTKVD